MIFIILTTKYFFKGNIEFDLVFFLKKKGNFGVSPLWDILMNTDETYRQLLQKQDTRKQK